MNLENLIKKEDPEKEYIILKDFVEHNLLPGIIKRSDLFIFASSCENMPIL